MTVEFSYNHNGLRTQKKVTKADGTVETTEYTLHGKLITHLTRGEDEMHFFYDNESRPAMVDFNGTFYGYVHNLQGDIVGIIDNAGNLVVEYVYDAWGKPVVVRTLTTAYETLAELNPFRYRGYVYDGETGLYYLRSRLYDHKTGRFINKDCVLVHSILGENAYCYCLNNSVIHADSSGAFALTTILGNIFLGAAVSFVSSIATDIISGGFGNISWEDAGIEAVKGGVSGFVGLFGSPLISGLTSFALDSLQYSVETGFQGDGEVYAYYGVTSLTSELVGLSLGAITDGSSNVGKTIMETGTDLVLDTALSVREREIRAVNEGRQHTEPYLATIRDTATGKYQEVVTDTLPSSQPYLATIRGADGMLREITVYAL